MNGVTYNRYYVLKNGEMLKSDHDIEEGIEVDEMMQPIISVLIQKGYKPVACCSGHICPIIDESSIEDDGDLPPANTYIAFEASAIDLINNGFRLPAGFRFDQENTSNDAVYKSCIRKIYGSKGDLWLNILQTATVLYRWVIGLPYIYQGGDNNG